MRVALTFDVESDFGLGRSFKNIRESLPSIVEVLKKEGIKSTFFVSGRVLEEFEDYVLDLLKGHEIASHGYNHTRLDKLNKLEIENEVRKSKIVFSEYGLEPMGFRAPKLCVNEKVLDVISNYYSYDSSILPFVLPFRYSNLLKRRVPHVIKDGFVEIPIGTVNFLRIPATSSWMFLFGKRYLNLLETFGYPEVFVLLFHSFDFIEYDKTKDLPFHKYKLYYSKCGRDKINFLKKLINLSESRGDKFVTCRKIIKIST